METMNESPNGKSFSAATIKKICLDAGADDVGLVDLDRESVQKEKEGILHVYPLTRSISAITTVSYGFRFSFDLDEKVMRVGFLDLIENPVF